MPPAGVEGVPPGVLQRYYDAIRGCVAPRRAATLLGVTNSTWYRWIARGRDDADGPYREFWDETQRAREEALLRLEIELRRHAQTDPQSARWMLSRLDPERWGTPGRRIGPEVESALHEAEVARAQANARAQAAKARLIEVRAILLENAARSGAEEALTLAIELLEQLDGDDIDGQGAAEPSGT